MNGEKVKEKERKIYRGRRLEDGTVWVTVNERPLAPRNDLADHSPDGFEWGYNGSGPAQLALAILANFLGDDESALRYYQWFKERVIALIPDSKRNWVLTSDIIGHEIEAIKNNYSR